jgi:hypothetical protein
VPPSRFRSQPRMNPEAALGRPRLARLDGERPGRGDDGRTRALGSSPCRSRCC